MRGVVAALAVVVTFAHPARAALDLSGATPAFTATRVNTTGHALHIAAELMDGRERLGDVPVEIGPDDSMAVDRAALLEVLRPHVSEGVLTNIAGLAPAGVMVPVSALTDVGGVNISFSPPDMGLVLNKNAASSGTSDIPLSRRPVDTVNYAPAAVSGFVNVTTNVDAVWDTPAGPPVNMNLEFDGAVRAWGWVLEGNGRLDGPLDSLICPAEAKCSYAHESGFKRQATRLIREFDGSGDVLTLGDISYSGYEVQRGNDVLGVGMRHDERHFGRDNRLDATASLLTLDSPGEVEVLVNGAPLEHLHLNTGTYRLTDLPLLTGANTVELLVTTADGQSRKIVLSALADEGMLRPGASEWSANIGVASFVRDAERSYLVDRYVANGYWRYGLSSLFTVDLHAQADADVAMAGAGLMTLTPFGLFSVGVAASAPLASPLDVTGFAVTAGWQYVRPAAGGRETASITARYASKHFTTPGNELVGETGILYPTLDPTFLVSGAWSYELASQWVVSGSGRYASANADSSIPGALDTGSRWGVDAALTVPLTRSLQASLWASYGNEHLLTFLSSPDTQTDVTVGTRLAWQPDARSEVFANTDSGLRSSSIYATTHLGSVHDGWDATASAVDTARIDSTVTAAMTRRSAFGDTSLVQTSEFEKDPFVSGDTRERTSLRSTTAVAFADGHIGVGPPIHDGFAVVFPHSSLGDSTITVGDAAHPDATGNSWLAAVVPDLPSHQVTTLPIDASDLPVGYSLGDGMLKVKPDYKAGYAVQVGSDHAVSVFGTLMDEHGQPVALTTGKATCGKHTVDLFTNARGRFGIEGVSAGDCVLIVDGPGGVLTYDLSLPSGSTLMKAGTLHPREKGEPAHVPWITVTVPPADRFAASR